MIVTLMITNTNRSFITFNTNHTPDNFSIITSDASRIETIDMH